MQPAIHRQIYQRIRGPLPDVMVNRFRLLILVLAISSTVAIWPTILAETDVDLGLRFLQIALISVIFWRWTRWYKTQQIHPADLLLELAAVAAVSYLTSDSSSVLSFVYTGVYFRPLFTNNRQTAIAAVGYATAFGLGTLLATDESLALAGPSILVQVVSLLLGAAIVRTVAVILERGALLTRELERAEREYRVLVEQLPGIVITFDNDSVAHYVSPRIHDLLGYDPQELLNSNLSQQRTIHADDARRVSDTFERCLASQQPITIEFRLYHANGDLRWIRFEANQLDADTATDGLWRGIVTDITEQHRLAEQLEHQAFHDVLTGLPNRSLFEARLKHTIDMQSRRISLHAVLFLDLDNFKVVNDSLGHTAGDQLLVAAAERIQGCLRQGDTVARLGGDEFAILLEDLYSPSEALDIAERICNQIAVVFHINDYATYVSASIGIAFNDSSRIKPEDLVRHADVAMYEAKNAGKSRYAIFSDDMEQRAWKRLQIESTIRGAFDRDEFRVFYQPVVDLRTGIVREIEALVRWEHPERGMLQPAEFLPLASEIGLMATLDAWVLEQACRQAVDWQQRYSDFAELIVSVNVSSALLQKPTMATIVSGILTDSGLSAASLRLEISEATMFDDIQRTLVAMDELHALGIHIAIDDFGTGNSAMSYLRNLPVDSLKIDRSFMSDENNNPDAMSIMAAVVTMAKSLGVSITVEGIEHRHQTQLQALGCDLGQGYYFAKPMPVIEVEAMLNANSDFESRIDHTA